MKTPADVIEALQNTNSRLDKERIVQAAYDAGIVEFFRGAQQALDVLSTFGVKQVPMITEDDGEGSYTWTEFATLLNQLQTRTLTGNAAKDALRTAAEKAPARDWNLWYRRILLKDLKCGTSESTINKVLKNNGKKALPYQVPVFSCQLAKPADDHPKKMVGEKFVDRKYDGVRLLTMVDTAGAVTQFTRNGICNTNFGHICEMLKGLAPLLTEAVVLDGEIISSNFQALMTQVNRKESVDTGDSKLVLFDIIPLKAFQSGEYAVSQADRHAALCELIPHLDVLTNGVVVVEPKLKVNLSTDAGKKTLVEFNKQVLSEGLEGVMVKDPAAPYKTKRSDAWMKIKPWITVDLTVVDVEQGKPESEFAHTMGALVCEGSDGGKQIRVNVGTGYSDVLREEIWQNRENILGRIVEIKGDALTLDRNQDTWSLRFPVFMGFRGGVPGEKI
jgi:DNA ligase-1